MELILSLGIAITISLASLYFSPTTVANNNKVKQEINKTQHKIIVTTPDISILTDSNGTYQKLLDKAEQEKTIEIKIPSKDNSLPEELVEKENIKITEMNEKIPSKYISIDHQNVIRFKNSFEKGILVKNYTNRASWLQSI